MNERPQNDRVPEPTRSFTHEPARKCQALATKCLKEHRTAVAIFARSMANDAHQEGNEG